MPLSSGDVIELVRDRLWTPRKGEVERLDHIDQWYRWTHEPVQLPRNATMEMRKLVELAKTPWLRLVVSTTAQALYVDGYRSPEVRDNSAAWEAWQRNDFDGRQVAVHRAALAYGYAFVTVLPGRSPLTGEDGAVMRGVSPRKMFAVYEDPAEDDFPVYALRVDPGAGGKLRVRLYDATSVYELRAEISGDGWAFVRRLDHDLGFCPVIRYANMLDLEGRTDGEVEPYIPLAQRIDKTTFDRLMTQHFNSWKVRTVAGLSEPDSEEEANRKKLMLRQDDLMIAEDPDTKFGTLPETPLDGFVRAGEADVKGLAASSQTPTHSLTGDLINLNAEALAAARAEHYAKVTERQTSLGRSHDLTMRTAALVDGDADGAADFTAHVTWQDMSIRSLSQSADALGKIAQMLGVPVQALWGRIPGVTKLDVDEWKALAAEGDALGALTGLLDQQAAGLSADVGLDGAGVNGAPV